MASLRRNLIVAATAILLVGCEKLGTLTAGFQEKDYYSLSSQLKKDMSEQEVSATIGSSPDKVAVVTCVDHAAKPWQCKTWIYDGAFGKKTLRLIFYQTASSEWRVASWDLY
jgi:hypothetical protein